MTAEVHGERVDADALVRSDETKRQLSWGAEGPDDYHGELQVDDIAPGRSRITVSLHSVREADGDEVQRGLVHTVAALAQAATADDVASRERGD
ncbi:MAG TPA: hypothetical protein VGP26_25615 [Actinophytocola sp.]|nr:hypothetical protein [Actinophytocola sp.]